LFTALPRFHSLEQVKLKEEQVMETRTLAERTRACAIKRMNEHALEQEAEFLNRAIFFDSNGKFLITSPYNNELAGLNEHVFRRLEINKYSKVCDKKYCLEIVLSNLIDANRRKRPISISRNTANYSGFSRYTKIKSCILFGILDALKTRGLIHQKIGYYFPDQGRCRLTRIWCTDKLLAIAGDVGGYADEGLDFTPTDLIILRDEKGDNINYHDTPRTNKLRERIRKANILNSSFQITYIDSNTGRRKLINPNLHAVFNNASFNDGGRLYTSKNGHQNLSSKPETSNERSTIEIAGQKTVELDFRALHIMLLYANEGIQYKSDPYGDIFPDKVLRPILKRLLLIFINAETELDAIHGGNFRLLYIDRNYRLLRERNLTVPKILDCFKDVHAQIAKHFCTGAGLWLMNKDAQIALDIVDHFASKNIPILPVHDSFIIQQNYESELRPVMMDVYKKHTGYEVYVE
jgi:hypothetical protein